MNQTGRKGKAWKRLLVGAAVGLPLLGIAIAAWQLERLRDQASMEVADALGAAFGAQATVRDVRVDFARMGLVVRGIEVRSGSRTLLSAAEAIGRPAFGPLLRGRLELHGLKLPAARVSLQAEDLSRLARGSSATRFSSLDIGDLELELDLERHGVIAIEHASLSGRRDAARTVAGKGQLRFEALLVNDRQLAGPTRVQWKFDADDWFLDTEAKLGRGTLGIRAKLAPAATLLQLSPRGVSVGEALELLGDPQHGLAGVVDGEIALHGTLAPLALAGSWKLTARDLTASRIARVPQLKAAGEAHLQPSGLRLEPLAIDLGHSQLHGRLSVSVSGGVTASLRGDDFDLADLGPIWGVGLAGRGQVEISSAEPLTRAHLALSSAAIGGKQLGRLTTDLVLDPAAGRLTLEHAEADSPERHLSADGSTLELEAAGLARAEAKLRVLRLPLRELYGLLGAANDPVLARLQGSSAGTAELTYRAANASQSASLDLTLGLQLSAIDLAGYPFERGRLASRISIPDRKLGLAGGTLSLSQLSLAAGSGTLELTGEIRRGQLTMQLGARGLPLERAPWLRARSRSLLTGVIDGRGSLSGEAASTRADLRLELNGLRLLGEPLGKIRVKTLLRPAPSANADDTSDCQASRAALTSPAFRGASAWLFCGDGLDGHLQVDLALGNGATRALRGRVSLADFALGPFLRGSQPSAAESGDPKSTLSAALELTGGGLADPEHLSGTLRVQKLTLGSGDSRLENVGPFELRSREGALELANGRLDGPAQHFTLTVGGTLGKDGRIIAEGEVDAGVFTRASEPLVKAFGNVAVHLEWTPGAQPAVRGRATLQELAIRGPGSVQARRLRGVLVLTGNRLRLDGVETDLGGGTVAVTGQLQLDGLRIANYDLAIDASRVSLEPEPLIQVELDATTKLSWRGASALPALSGNLILRRLAYGKPLHLEALAAMNRPLKGAPPHDRLNLDLTVEQREPLRVRNTLLDGELSITGDHKLHVVGTDQRLGVLGELTVTRGRIVFQGDQFHFTRGDISLHDPARIAPHFDVRAVADQPRRRDTSVVLSAQGTRDAFKVAIHCDAGAALVEAPPFTCNYTHDRMSCDDFDRLVAQWSCPTAKH